ncbi:BspA family leucine-rich repeat surface protein, partial [Metamycoplasma auris]|uniref:BspA family leucine-rich repeat surface protein n=1 Tax=Metamycoplasma auris TaxID=51363 RepID=UPI0011B813D9
LIKEYENRFPNLKDKEYVFDDFDLTIPIGFSKNPDGTLKVRIKTFISVLSNDYTSSTVSLYGKINIKYPEKSEWDPETMASPTHYIDKYGNARFSYKRDFWDDEYNNINKIIKIGYFYINSKEVHTNGYSYPFNSKTIKIPLIQSPTMPRHINKVPELPEVITSIANMFYNNKSPNINGIEDWDTSNVVVMSSTFELSNFNQNISNWDTSNVDYMDRMFSWAKVFNQDISGWDVWKVKSMVQMFWAASSFNQPLNNWDVSQVTYMSCMFWGASSFNQPLDDWNVSKVKNMDHMFHNAVNFNQPLNSWNTKNVQDMNSMFFAAKRFNQPLNKWDVSNVENMKNMFNRATSFNQPLDRWKPKSLETMESMFWGASSFNQDLSSWHLAKNAAR